MNASLAITRERVPLPPKPEPDYRDLMRQALREREASVRHYAYLAANERQADRTASAEFYEAQLAAVTIRRDRTRDLLNTTDRSER